MRNLTQNRLRCGVFRGVEELIAAIFYYIDLHNGTLKPFNLLAAFNNGWGLRFG